jgi:hypothetical protein
LDTVSDELGKRGEAPSFGDLFDEPDSPGDAGDAGGPAGPAGPAGSATPGASDGPPAAAARAVDVADSPAEPAAQAEDAGPAARAEDAEPATDRSAVDEVPAKAAEAGPKGSAADGPEFVAPLAATGLDDEPALFEPDAIPASSSLDAAPAVAAAAAAAAVASRPAPPVQTGRLFRSAGAEGPATLDAIPAIDPEYLAAKQAQRQAEAKAAPKEKAPRKQGGSGLTWSGVAVVVVLGTVLVAFADAVINNSLGILTGIALLVTSVYCALLVRPADIWAAVVMPPLGFLAAALTAGQLTLDSAGSLVVREGYMLLKTLAQGAPWIIGTTAICLGIVLVRRRRTAGHA